jgi:hypothetical protein
LTGSKVLGELEYGIHFAQHLNLIIIKNIGKSREEMENLKPKGGSDVNFL